MVFGIFTPKKSAEPAAPVPSSIVPPTPYAGPLYTRKPAAPKPSPTPTPALAATTKLTPEEPEAETYVLNSNTKKFHFPDCKSVNTISPKNRRDFEGSREDVLAMGYVPCKRCKP